MTSNLSSLNGRLDKIEKQLKTEGIELLVAWDVDELKKAEEKVEQFKDEHPGEPVPYQIMKIDFVEASSGKPAES